MVRTLYDEIEDEKRYSFEKGKVEGKIEGIKAIAKKLKDSGMDPSEIATLTNLTADEIKKL